MLLAEGVRVWGTARDCARLGAIAQQPHFSAVALDLAQPAEAERVFLEAAHEVGGAFDLVINNAGYGFFAPFAATEFAAWQAQLDAVLTTTVRLSHAALRGMLAQNRGCLVNISSLVVEFPLPFMSGYNVAKAGLSALSESLIFETRGTGITVIDFRPGDYRTAFNQAMHSTATAAGSDRRLAPAWAALEAHLKASPLPGRAVRDLRAALDRGRSGTVRSGSFFQARLAPLFSRLIPASVRRAVIARYQGAA